MKPPKSELWNLAVASLEERGGFDAIRASGPGGQHVNKTSSAVQYRVALRDLALPESVLARLLAVTDHRISPAKEILIKAQATRSQHANKLDALARAKSLLQEHWYAPRNRRATKPSRAVKRRRAESKSRHSEKKRSRRAPFD